MKTCLNLTYRTIAIILFFSRVKFIKSWNGDYSLFSLIWLANWIWICNTEKVVDESINRKHKHPFIQCFSFLSSSLFFLVIYFKQNNSFFSKQSNKQYFFTKIKKTHTTFIIIPFVLDPSIYKNYTSIHSSSTYRISQFFDVNTSSK